MSANCSRNGSVTYAMQSRGKHCPRPRDRLHGARVHDDYPQNGSSVPGYVRKYLKSLGPFESLSLDENIKVIDRLQRWRRGLPRGHPAWQYIQDALNEGGPFAERMLEQGFYSKWTKDIL